jgi:hypothetical protein
LIFTRPNSQQPSEENTMRDAGINSIQSHYRWKEV